MKKKRRTETLEKTVQQKQIEEICSFQSDILVLLLMALMLVLLVLLLQGCS